MHCNDDDVSCNVEERAISSLTTPQKEKIRMGCRQWVIILSSALSGFQFGFDTATINAAIFQMKNVFGFEDDSWRAGLVVAIAVAGAFTGALFSGLVSYRVGRRTLTAIADVAFILGSIAAAVAGTLWLEIFARFFVGAGIGISSVVAPMYLAEVSHADIRGAVIVLNNVFLTGAQFVAAVLGAVLVTYTADDVGFRILFGIGAAPALLQLVALIWLPESPRWLALQGRLDEARQVASLLNVEIDFGEVSSSPSPPPSLPSVVVTTTSSTRFTTTAPTTTEDVDHQLPAASIPHHQPHQSNNDRLEHAHLLPSTRPDTTTIPSSSSSSSSSRRRHTLPTIAPMKKNASSFTFLISLGELCSPCLRRRFMVGMMLQVIQQLSGINTIMYYSSTVLKKVGFNGDTAPVLLSVPLAFTNGLCTVIGIFVIERWGRRVLLIRSLAGCALMTVAMTVIGSLMDTGVISESNGNERVGGWTFLGSLMVYLAFFAPGIGACPWVVNAEIYPNHLRGDAVSLATMANWGSNAVVSQVFPILLGQLGTGPTFGVISCFVMLGLAFVARYMPETKGVPLEAMNSVFDK